MDSKFDGKLSNGFVEGLWETLLGSTLW